jgi:hypothetical protein
MHTVLKSLRNAVDVDTPYEGLVLLCKEKNSCNAYRMPTSDLESARADAIIPHEDITLERLGPDLFYQELEIKAGTILGVYPGDIFSPHALKVKVTPYYLANIVREILTNIQYKKKHRIFNIPLYTSSSSAGDSYPIKNYSISIKTLSLPSIYTAM